jgi:hypothetical protein
MAEYKLSDEAIAAGLSFGQNENIREEDRQAALAQFRAQMNAANSPEVYSAPQPQRMMPSNAQAPQMIQQPMIAPQTPQSRVAQSPEVYSPPRLPAVFESGYPVPRRVNQEPFEGGYPGPRNVQLPPQMFDGNQNQGSTPGTYLNSRVNPYVQDAASNFLNREDRAYQTAPLSREMVNNPARERLMRAIGENSAETYRRNAVNEAQMPNILAKQARDELTNYRSGKKSEAELRRLARAKEKWSRENGVPMDYDSRAYEPDVEGERMANRTTPYKKGGAVKKTKAKLAKSKASKRGDGIAQRGKTKGRMV